MEISALNITISIRNLYNEASQRFLRIGQMIAQIWNRINGNKQEPKENFISYIKDHDFKLVKPPKVIKFTIPEDTPTVDFDRIRREFDSLKLRNAIENKESVFFQDDFVSTSDWAHTAVQDQEALDSYIMPIIEEADTQKQQLTSQIQEELERVKEELNKVDQAKQEQEAFEIQSHHDGLENLEKEKQEDLQYQLKALEEELNISKQRISNFQSLTENLADEYMNSIAKINEKYNMQSNELSKIVKNLAKQRKKFASSRAKESLERLEKDFTVRSLEIHKTIELKYNEKKIAADETLQENLTYLEEDRLKAREIIKQLSNEKINSITSEIEDLRKNLTTNLSSARSKNEEVETFFEALEEQTSIEEDEPLIPSSLKEDTLQESESSTDPIEQSANSPEVFLEISLQEDRAEGKEMAPQDSLMTTIHKTYNLLYEALSGTLVTPYSFHF